MPKKFIEEAEYRVEITLTIVIPFSPIERDSRLCQLDGVNNALGSVRDGLWDELEDAGFTIESKAERI